MWFCDSPDLLLCNIHLISCHVTVTSLSCDIHLIPCHVTVTWSLVMWQSPPCHVTVTSFSCDSHLLVMWQSPPCHVTVTSLSCDNQMNSCHPTCHVTVNWLHVLPYWLSCDSDITWQSPGLFVAFCISVLTESVMHAISWHVFATHVYYFDDRVARNQNGNMPCTCVFALTTVAASSFTDGADIVDSSGQKIGMCVVWVSLTMHCLERRWPVH